MAEAWRPTTLGQITDQSKRRVGRQRDLTVLSSTKHDELVPSSQYFKGRQIFSDDIAGYKTADRGQVVYATNHLTEGSIGLQRDYARAAVSPIYTVLECGGEVNPEYLIRVLKSPELLTEYKIHEQASVDRRGAVRYSDFATISISLPSPPEQERIVEILDDLDDKVRSVEKVIAKQRLTKEGLAAELFTRGLNEDGELRKVDEVDDSVPLGPMPRDWSMRSADSLFSIQLGKMLDSKRIGSGKRLGYLTNRDVQWGQIGIDGLETMPFSRGEQRKFALQDGDVLMCEGGEVGRCAVWRNGNKPIYYQKALHRLRSRGSIDPDYFVAYMEWVVKRNGLASWVGRTSIAHFPLEKLSAFPVRLPCEKEQARIVAAFASIDQSVEAHSRLLAKLRLLRKGLAADLLGGRVRVPVEDTA